MVSIIIGIVVALMFGVVMWLQVIHIIHNNNETWWKLNGNKNFPIKHKGKTVWISRSVAVVGFVFCKDEEGNWYVLANKRGKGTPDFQGLWNLVCGYIEKDETGEEAVVREINEETGLELDKSKFELCRVSTNPKNNRQNISLGYMTILDGTIADHSNFNKNHMEKDEVEEIKWIKISTLFLYEWAFGHDEIIQHIYSTKIDKDD